MEKLKENPEISEELVMNKIYVFREQKVMLDSDLAYIYGVVTKRLKEAVRRNIERFPEDFMFELTREEFDSLRTQIASSKTGRGGARYLPMAFTEQGIAMLSSVLNSERAIRMNIQLIRIFTNMRKLVLSQKDMLLQLEKIERKVISHDEGIALIFEHLKRLIDPVHPPRRRIGFKSEPPEETADPAYVEQN